ncbi:microtubule interacting and transport domain-containing protein [Dictyostelium discoideum AX4]|uniref:Microtubule interacting and transport domain-containing protein n=1 Tax=Dictyostelium discoideum TaxID=44689 RepID=Q8T127_DICDI|nr:microtubule interacting and transport domain-containing protein [Dictyostelium discoideum AX4]EAL69254.1 microtubule interacting and transport domain-containing protein [Dictyostelium discoideum AX4]|eukprot:XP_643186.1 microtubule interacting and transport domain-containing protein [Dictyostelium discoideum AX4]
MADTTLLLQKSYTLIQQAAISDRNGQYSIALNLYTNGLEGLMSALKLEKNDRVIQTLKIKITEYFNRAEQLKDIIKKGYVAPPLPTTNQSCHDCVASPPPTPSHYQPPQPVYRPTAPTAPPPSQYHPIPTNTDDLILPSVPTFNPLPTPPPPFNPSVTNNISSTNSSSTNSSSSSSLGLVSSKKIENGSIGNSYETLFGDKLIGSTWIKVEDPYIRTRHQIDNFVKLIELVISKCIFKDLKSQSDSSFKLQKPSTKFKIDLTTSTESQQQEDELKLTFYQLKDQISTQYNIVFNYQFSSTIHDRSIECSNGYLIK